MTAKTCKVCKKDFFEFKKQICSDCRINLDYILNGTRQPECYRFAKFCLTLDANNLQALLTKKRNDCKGSGIDINLLRTEIKIIIRAYWILGFGNNIEEEEHDSEEFTQ